MITEEKKGIKMERLYVHYIYTNIGKLIIKSTLFKNDCYADIFIKDGLIQIKFYEGFLSELSDMLTCTESSTTAFYFKYFDNVWFEISEDFISISFIDSSGEQVYLNCPIEQSFTKMLEFEEV